MAVPKLKFKADDGSEFPEWEEKCIDTEFDFYNGVAHENNVVEKGKYIVVNSKFISSDGKIKKYSDVANFPLMIDDIVMVMSDVPNGKAIAKCFLIDKNDTYTLNQRICCLRTKHNAIFMLNQINRNNYFLRFDDGIKQTNLRKEDILRCPIYVPSVLEQQKMAEFLSTIDDIITTTEAELTAWQERKKGVMQKIFNREVRFKADDGSEFPEWEEKRLGEVCDIVGGGTPDTEKAEYWGGDVNWFTPSEIGETKYVVKSNRQISKLGLLKSSAKLLPQGTILLTSRATLGEMAIVKQECCTNQGFQSLIVKQECLNEFIYYYQPIIKRYCEKHASGSTFLEISKKEISGCKLGVPSLPEQRKIAECLSSLDDVINQIDAELSAWKEFKKGLLQQMFV